MAKRVIIGIVAPRHGKGVYGASTPIYGVVDDNSTEYKRIHAEQMEFIDEIARKVASERLAEIWRIVELVHAKAEKHNKAPPPDSD